MILPLNYNDTPSPGILQVWETRIMVLENVMGSYLEKDPQEVEFCWEEKVLDHMDPTTLTKTH